MGKFAAFILGFSFLASSSSMANILVNCVDPKVKKGPTVISYSIANTASSRLASDITVNGQLVSSFQVAQYKATKSELFLLLDDATETTPTYLFQAGAAARNSCDAQLTTYTKGKPSTKTLKCTLTAQ